MSSNGLGLIILVYDSKIASFLFTLGLIGLEITILRFSLIINTEVNVGGNEFYKANDINY